MSDNDHNNARDRRREWAREIQAATRSPEVPPPETDEEVDTRIAQEATEALCTLERQALRMIDQAHLMLSYVRDARWRVGDLTGFDDD